MRDIAAITYAANPNKKGLDIVLDAWRGVAKPGEELLVAGVEERELRSLGYALPTAGVRAVGMLAHEDYRALLRRARTYVCAARREDYGIAQLEALVDGCMLVTTPSPGPYAALPLARELDGRLVTTDFAASSWVQPYVPRSITRRLTMRGARWMRSAPSGERRWTGSWQSNCCRHCSRTARKGLVPLAPIRLAFGTDCP